MEEGEFIPKVLNTVQVIIADVFIATKYLYKDVGKGCDSTGVLLQHLKGKKPSKPYWYILT